MKFFSALISTTDPTVDSLNIGGLVAIIALVAFSGYDLIGLHHGFSPLTFGTGVATILAGLGGGKRLRDGVTNAQ